MFGAISAGIAGIGLAGSLFGAKEDKHAQHKANRRYKKYSKELYEMQRSQIQWKKDLDLQNIADIAERVGGTQRVAYAGRGVRVSGAGGEGTVANVLRRTYDMALKDMQVIKQQAEYDVQETRLRYKAGQPAGTTDKGLSTLLTAGSSFVAGGFGFGGQPGWYGLKF